MVHGRVGQTNFPFPRICSAINCGAAHAAQVSHSVKSVMVDKDLCSCTTGVYVKAGQFAAAFGAVPREFRVVLAGLEDRATPRPFKAVQVRTSVWSLLSTISEPSQYA